jgi:hypothetical protein
MYSYGETEEIMYFYGKHNLLFKYKPDLSLIGRSSVMVQYSFSEFEKTTQP